MSSPSKRREMDLMKLYVFSTFYSVVETEVLCRLMADYELELSEENQVSDFYVKFHGPSESK